jgi:hypothetical protein
MRAVGGLGFALFALLFAGGLSAQSRANNPSMPRFTPHPVYPGGGGSRGAAPTPRLPRQGFTGASYVYVYPVYVPVTGPSPYVDATQADSGQDAGSAEPSPDTIVIYTSQPAQEAPTETAHPAMHVYQSETPQASEETPAADHFLFAFKDHSIYSAVAYWVDGDTLHYFTNGNTHNQVSLSLLDRDLTERLNQESGADLKLPPAKNQ